MAREMKDSGIEWIGEIPIGWCTPKIINRFDLIGSGTTPRTYEDDNYADGGINWIQSGDLHGKYLKNTSKTITQTAFERTSTLKMYFPEYLVVAMYGASVGNLSIATIEACTNQACCVLTGEKDDLMYMYYVLMAAKEYLVYSAIGGTQPNISQDVIKKLRIPIPVIVEQQKIADFLDKKFAELDNVFEKTRASIEEYKKLKQAVITQAVTKGIRGNREMKDSGIEWIEKIPVEWEERRIKTLFDLREEKNYLPLEEVNLISLYTDLGVVQHSDLEKTTGNKASNADGYKKVCKDDIVVNIILCWMGAIGCSEYEGVTSPAYDIYIPQNEVLSKFYHYYFRTKGFSGDCYKRGRGIMAMRWRTYSDQFRDIRVVYPSMEEQREIADYLDQKCLAIDELIAKKEQSLSEIENYKKSLIYEYVTGKKEVTQGYKI